MVAPDDLYLYPHTNSHGKVRARGRFSLGPSEHLTLYDFPITETPWERIIINLGPFTLRQSDFRIKPVSVAGGTLKLKDELKFAFDVVARKQG